MNWSEIAERYKKTGINLIEKTNEGTRSLKNGLGQGQQDLLVIRRTHKILLRAGFEFLVKSLYLRKGWNIYEFKINPLIRFEQLSQISESNLNLDKTINFKRLIDNLNLILIDYSGLSDIQGKLHVIRGEGNNAIHSDDISETEVEKTRELMEKLNGV